MKRYHFEYGVMGERESGEWVRAEDATKDAKTLRKAWALVNSWATKLEAENERLKKIAWGAVADLERLADECETEVTAARTLREEIKDVQEDEDYDPGLMNDYGGGNVGWWMDYIRAEVGRCNDYWRSRVDALAAGQALRGKEEQ